MKIKWWVINGVLAIGLWGVSLRFARLDPQTYYPAAEGFGAGLGAFALGYVIVAIADKPNPDKWQRRRKRTTLGLVIATIIVLLLNVARMRPGLG